MLEIITKSGAVLYTDPSGSSTYQSMVSKAVDALGGSALQHTTDDRRDAVLTIMDQGTIGTELTDGAGEVYTLWPNGWMHGDEEVSLPPYESIVSAKMPGGWSWAL